LKQEKDNHLKKYLILLILSLLVSCNETQRGPLIKGIAPSSTDLVIENKCSQEEYNDYATVFDICHLDDEYYFQDSDIANCQNGLNDFTDKHGKRNCNVLNDMGKGSIKVGYDYLSGTLELNKSKNQDFHEDTSGDECSFDLTYEIINMLKNDYKMFEFELNYLELRARHINCIIPYTTESILLENGDVDYFLEEDLFLTPDLIEDFILKISILE